MIAVWAMSFEPHAILKYVNLIDFLLKLISKDHVIVIMEFPDWVQVLKSTIHSLQ